MRPLSWNEIKSRALAFSRRWADAANEDSEAKPFWLDFFECFGITNKRVATFELNVKKHGGTIGFVDLFWPGMLLVEQKSRGKDLDQAFAQATDYLAGIAERDLPQIIIVSDFARFRVYELASGQSGQYTEFALSELHEYVRLFGFIAGYKAQRIEPQNPVNIKAAERMGRLHDALKSAGYGGHALEVLLVRLLFCLFADDTAIFQPAQAFRCFVEERTAVDGSDLGARLAQLFQVLNTPEPRRSKNLDEQLAAFPYINGRLFEESLPIADFDRPTRNALLDACALDWSAISPAIFGSLFQSIMDEKARRHLGAHYTSEENILKLIGPLFLDELRAEFAKVKRQRNKLLDFHKKLRTLRFFDPACGCGNFLVISYRELRLLELQVLRAAAALAGHAGQQSLDVHQLIGVNVDQFYGIEIEEFPAQIAQVALWLMDHQMNLRASEEFGLYFARIPLVTGPHIVHGNALTLDWNEVLPASQCSYVLGNPPFVGAKFMSDAQRADTRAVFAGIDNAGLLDLVAAWYVKATKYMQGALDITTAISNQQSAISNQQSAISNQQSAISNQQSAISNQQSAISNQQSSPLRLRFHQQHHPGRTSGRPVELAAGARRAHPLCAPHLCLEQRSARQGRRALRHHRLRPARPAGQSHLRIR
nr:DNA methyltransferase [Vandammella animalimorsus]